MGNEANMGENPELKISDLNLGMTITRSDGTGGGKIEAIAGEKVTIISAEAGYRVTATMRFFEGYRIVNGAEEERASQ